MLKESFGYFSVIVAVLNYIPYVGPAIMDVLLFVIGLVTFPTLLGALLPPAVFIGITLIEGQFLTPAIVGRRVLKVGPQHPLHKPSDAVRVARDNDIIEMVRAGQKHWAYRLAQRRKGFGLFGTSQAMAYVDSLAGKTAAI